MKPLKYLLWTVIFIFVFLLGLWVFAPWQRAGLYALDTARLKCAQNGIFINYDNFTHEGVLSPTYRMKTLDVESPMAKISLSGVEIRIYPLESLFRRGATCRIRFGNSEITMIPENKISLTGGEMKCVASAQALAISETDISGELQVTGEAVYDRINGKIPHSTLLLKVPENINTIISNPLFSRFIESTGDGEWRVKQNAPPK